MDLQQQFLLFGITPGQPSPLQLTQINDLFQQGLDYLYIRSEARDTATWNRLLAGIQPDFYSRLLLPGNAPANAAGGRYIRHLRERERVLRQGEETSPQAAFSTSVHQLATVPQLAAFYDFVFYSPVFPSISKPGYQPQLELKAIEKQISALQQPAGQRPCIIGLGGVYAGNIGRVKAAGFHGAALLGALWQSDSPLQALADIRSQI